MSNTICIIIPAYNEANRLQKNIFLNFIQKNEQVTILFVNDGSSDNTANVIEELAKENNRILLLNNTHNQGKANAVHDGMMHAIKNIEASFYAYLDADLSTPLDELLILQNEFILNPTLQFVFGSRILKIGSQIKRKGYRHYIGRIVATCISMQLQLPIYDTQCGAKIFRKELVEIVFKEKFMSKWLFDVEIFNRLINYFSLEKTKEISKEIPLTKWTDIDGSKIGLIDIIKTPIDLLKIAFHYKK